MTTRYLLPCSCGRKIPVEPRQAGQTVRCACGTSLKVPTMLNMAALERAEPESAPARPAAAWGARQCVLLLGTVIVLVSLGLAIYLYRTPPTHPTAEAIRRAIQAETPVQSWHRWHYFRAKGPDPRTRVNQRAYAAAVSRHRLWIGVALTFAAGGVALIAIPLLKGRSAG